MFPFRKLLVVVLMLGLFTIVGVSQACCGTTPNYYINVSIVGTPICDYRSNSGRVNWTVTYNLPTNHNARIDTYGDGVDQGSDYFPQLPQTPGAQVNTLSSYTIWDWQVPRPQLTSYKVRVQFEAYNDSTGFHDWALIVFDCTARGVTNIVVHNGP